jgi:hypothetical protein
MWQLYTSYAWGGHQFLNTHVLRKWAYENSVVFMEDHFDSIAENTGVGTGYSVIKCPWVSLTLRVTPRLIVCLRLHALSVPFVEVEIVD